MNDLDLVLKVLAKIAEKNGVMSDQLNNEIDLETENFKWLVEYRHSLQEQFSEDLKKLIRVFELIDDAIEKKDETAICVGLSTACTNSAILANMFQSIYSDCLKMLNQDQRFNWPEIPNDYKTSV